MAQGPEAEVRCAIELQEERTTEEDTARSSRLCHLLRECNMWIVTSSGSGGDGGGTRFAPRPSGNCHHDKELCRQRESPLDRLRGRPYIAAAGGFERGRRPSPLCAQTACDFFHGVPVSQTGKDGERNSLIRQAAVLSAIPGFLVVPPVVGVLVGRWLDQRFHTAPWLLLVFLLLGFGSGVRLTMRTLRTVRQMQERDESSGKR